MLTSVPAPQMLPGAKPRYRVLGCCCAPSRMPRAQLCPSSRGPSLHKGIFISELLAWSPQPVGRVKQQHPADQLTLEQASHAGRRCPPATLVPRSSAHTEVSVTRGISCWSRRGHGKTEPSPKDREGESGRPRGLTVPAIDHRPAACPCPRTALGAGMPSPLTGRATKAVEQRKAGKH